MKSLECKTAEELVAENRFLLEQLAQTEEKLKETENFLNFMKASVDAMPNPIFIKDEALRFVFFNEAYRKFFGLAEGENIGKCVLDLDYLSESDKERYHAEDTKNLNEQAVIQYETSFHTSNNSDELPTESLYWSKGFTVTETGSRGVVGEIVDISELKSLQRELTRSLNTLEILMNDAKNKAKIDPLTKLYNRSVLVSDVPAVTNAAATEGKPVCVMLMDIDYFKQINDTYGHHYGDEVLLKFAEILQKSFRQEDMILRHGGDEFMVVLFDVKLKQAREIAERLCHTVRNDIKLPDGHSATISAGIAEQSPQDTFQSFLTRADEALYVAKRAGRNRVAVL